MAVSLDLRDLDSNDLAGLNAIIHALTRRLTKCSSNQKSPVTGGRHALDPRGPGLGCPRLAPCQTMCSDTVASLVGSDRGEDPRPRRRREL